MKIYKYPTKEKWFELIKRPTLLQADLDQVVKGIIQQVKEQKDKALFDLTEKFDKTTLTHLQVSEKVITKANQLVSEPLKRAIQRAAANIEKFHAAQQESPVIVETTSGVKCWRKSIGIETVGIYIPGGTAPLFSTILMLGIPAKLANCKEIVICTPPTAKGEVHPAILYTASLIGIKQIYKIGGAQAIAAMAFGTETIPKVYKIFGPGNQFVTRAKELVQQEGVAIDLPAGPSEVLIVADKTCRPKFVAADLLAQAEHGADSQVVLLTDDESLIEKVNREVKKQLEELPRKKIAAKALEISFIALLSSVDECMAFSNLYAPEHLIIASEEALEYVDQVESAGSVFLGNYSCESAGDYASGTNHTLPTNGFARNYSGVSLDSFCKKITFQEVTKEGIQNLGPTIELMAEAEALFAHKNAVSLRLQSLANPVSLAENSQQ